MLTPEIVALTDTMQRQCVQAYLAVTANLRAGMSEAEIARAVQAELQAAGIADFWYDIPIVVFVGVERFMQSVLADYAVKSPSEHITLQANTPFFVDIHPRHQTGRWGNFAACGIYQPAGGEQVELLERMQHTHHEGIARLRAEHTGADVARWFLDQFQANNIEHVDVRANFGHSMGAGSKRDYTRLFLDESNTTAIGGTIYGIEPGGVRRNAAGQVIAFARFEDCVYVPRDDEHPPLLGGHGLLPVVFG
jgi:Xaa-Pro aminopeptidase